MQRFPFLLAGGVVSELRGVALGGSARQHQGELRHALAVTAGVGALGIDGAGDQLNEGVEQLLLPGQQALAFDAQGCAEMCIRDRIRTRPCSTP